MSLKRLDHCRYSTPSEQLRIREFCSRYAGSEYTDGDRDAEDEIRLDQDEDSPVNGVSFYTVENLKHLHKNTEFGWKHNGV